MTDSKKKSCEDLLDHLAEGIDGEVPPDLRAHVAECDACRDLMHDAAAVAERIRDAGEGYVAPIDMEERVLGAIDAKKTATKSDVAAKTEEMPSIGGTKAAGGVREDAAQARDPRIATVGQRMWRARRSVGAGLALAAAVTIGVIALRPKNGPAPQAKAPAQAPWKGTVAVVVGNGNGLTIVDDQGKVTPLKKGDTVVAGAHVRTDVRTRARIELDDGSALVLDRGADLALDKTENRTAKLASGSLVVEVSPKEGGGAKVAFPGGSVSSEGAKIALSSQDGSGKPMTSLAVAKGVASVTDDGGHTGAAASGEGGTIGGGPLSLGTTSGLGAAFAWSELGEVDLGENAEVPGLGELRARLPGAKNDGDKPLKLAKQSVKVRIAGEIARTEIEETFASDDPKVLEGIFRFPLPPDAEIERLALDVDGKMMEGSFVEKEKGKKIWTGVTYNAQPNPIKPQPREEWIWVPGPWSDPALLEWNAGGRMELKIYPIPAKGSRRVILAYTQHVAPSAGVRRYVYPLPRFAQGASPVTVDDFSLDVQVMGQDLARGVKMKGYEINQATEGGAVKGTFAKTAFVPTGDVVVEYAKAGEGATATTYAYQVASGGASYVALSLHPALPRMPDGSARTQVIVVDTSRSMIGERFTRATAVAARVVEEMDPRDRFTVLACDVSCVPLAVTTKSPGKKAADEVRTFLGKITPDGAADLVSMMKTAAGFAKNDPSDKLARKLRVVYVGDGTGSIGARTPATLEAGIKAALPAESSVTAVSVGLDVDMSSLEAIARGGGGVVVPYVSGEKLGSVALDVLEATYGVSLRDAELQLPPGLEDIAPARLGALRAGDETLVVARMSGKEVTGEATLKGTVAGQPWSTKIPISVRSSTDDGNAFVPRLYAAKMVHDLESRPIGDAEKQKIIDLSKGFAVPSRFTSLIVLESEAMSKAFGVEQQQHVALWTGDKTAVGTSTGAPTTADPSALDDTASLDHLEKSTLGSGGGDGLGGLGTKGKGIATESGGYYDAPMGAGGSAGPKPAATTTAAAPPPVAAPKMDAMPVGEDKAAKKAPTTAAKPMPGGGGGTWMRREWYRTVTFAGDGIPPIDLETKITTAKAAVVGAPDSRDKLADLFGLLSRRDDLSEADQVMGKWIGRDPLDSKALLLRSDLAARKGDRLAALRIETGAIDVREGDVFIADALANVALRAGDAKLACSLRAVHAELRPGDVDPVARRVACLRLGSDEATATALLGSLDPKVKTAVEARLPAVAAEVMPPAAGDMTLDATWSSGSPIDIDLAIIDPKGVRLSWMSTNAAIRAADVTSTTHETLALPWASGGTYSVEITRPSLEGNASPVTGTVNVHIMGQARAFPFTLTGARTVIGKVNINWASRMVSVGGGGMGWDQ